MQIYRTVLTVDDKGRVVLPVKVREELELKKGDTVLLIYEDGYITLSLWESEGK